MTEFPKAEKGKQPDEGATQRPYKCPQEGSPLPSVQLREGQGRPLPGYFSAVHLNFACSWSLLLLLLPTQGGSVTTVRTFLVVQWLRLCVPNSGGLDLTPDQTTGSHMLQLRVHTP